MIHKKSTNRFYPISGFPGYFINKTTSEVLCTNEDLPVILDQIPNSLGKDNYYLVVLSDGKNHFVHRLMAKTFLPGPEKVHVNHIDGNKQNNTLSNLEWATSQENAQHAVATGLTTYEIFKKEVHQYTLSGEYIASFPSDVIAEQNTGVSKQNISKCALGHRIHAGGYQWRRVLLPRLSPCNVKLLKGARVYNVTTQEEAVVSLDGQDFFGPIIQQTGISKHTLQRRFTESDVIFVSNFRIEKVYFS